MALQLQTIRDAYDEEKKDISDVSQDLFVQWNNTIANFAYTKLKNMEPERFLLTSDFTITTNPQTETLPTGFRDLNAWGAGLYLMDGSDITDTVLPITSPGSTVGGYYLNGLNIVFTGMTEGTYRMRYIPARTEFTAQTDYFTLDTLTDGVEILGAEYLTYIIRAIDVQYTIWDEDPSAESMADQRFINVLTDLYESFRRTPMVYGFKDQSQNY